MSTARHLSNAYSEYVAIEQHSNVRHEFLGGEIYAMAGGTPEHGALAFRIGRVLESSLPGCTPYSFDVRVHIEVAEMTTYPDVSVVCGPVSRSATDPFAIVNPTVVVEVTSPTTESYDRAEKLEAYQRLSSVRAVLFVSHREPRITVVERRGSTWTTTDFSASQRVILQSPAAEFSVDDVYSVLGQV